MCVGYSSGALILHRRSTRRRMQAAKYYVRMPTDVGLLGMALGRSGGNVGHGAFGTLMATGRPWIAEFKEFGKRLGHFVIVDGMQNGNVFIRDPDGVGTTYEMTLDAFNAAWNGNAVF